ncbi:6624_t:CDS:2 [Funneliformis caledonium]|uniref:6624_t:CDS:1 n=1 Tax=Funneliformis caledonium TaxID=1117310 RepID=A0A9N9I8X6_9GLOM|nr:6624_t:CDS:2 [Funneliformis caledonium]
MRRILRQLTVAESSTDHITEEQYLLIIQQHIAAYKELEDHKISFITHLDQSCLQSYFIRAQESEASFSERNHLLKYLLRKIVTTIRYRDNILKESFDSIADKLYQIWGSNESSPGMTLRQYDEEENDTYAPDYEQNILFGYVNDDDETLQGTSFFDNANELERGGTSNRIPRRVTFNTSNNRRSLSPVRVENVQQLVALTLSSNQSSRPSNFRVMTSPVGNTNNGLSLENPYNFFQATQYSHIFNPLSTTIA